MPDEEIGRQYGTVSLTPTDDVVAGSFATWELTYTVGEIGMDDGSRLKIAANVSSDWGRPQFDDPQGDNYATVETSGDATIEASYNHRGYERPFRNTIDIDVSDGALGAGETITLTLGDRSDGSMGHQVQSFPERDYTLIALVDAFETGEYVEVPGELSFDVVAGAADRLRAVVPSETVPGEEIVVSVRAEDYWGNAATGYDGALRFEDEEGTELDRGVYAVDGVARAPVVFHEPGVHRVRVVDEDRGLEVTTNPVVCDDDLGEKRVYWGDIHGQSGETVGTGTIQEYFAFAKEKAFLDFASHAGNDFQITDVFWDEIQRTIQDFHEPEEFVTFLCYEWSANTPNGGDHNVYFLDDEAEIHRSSSWQVNEDHEKHHGTWPIEDLYDHYEGRDDVMIIPHQGGRPATLDAFDPELTPFIEIISVWGIFEWFGHEALERGYPVGFVGGSDDHTGRLGASYPTNEADWPFPIKGGMMAARAETLQRESLWKAFKRRECYATTGARILLDVQVDGDAMGSEVTVADSPEIDVGVRGTAPIHRIDLFRGTDRIASRDFAADGDADRIELTWSGARSKDRHKVQDWSGGLSLDHGRIAAVEEVGFDHPNQGVQHASNTVVRWDGLTAGNYQGLRLELDAPDDATISVNTDPVSAHVTVDELGEEPHVIDAGPVDRQLEIRRIGTSSTLDTDVTFEDDPEPGIHPYYVRVRQEDGEMAWSSPIFVTVE